MKTSKYFLSTLKKDPKKIEVKSHQLMLKAGMICQLSSGLYSWLPTGFRVLQKIKNIIRKEMNKIGALEIAMPLVQPAILWKKSNRWKKYGSELLRFINRNSKSFVLGPTHEEVITNLINNQIHSYKELPLNLYQITTKFRDEVRPCYGTIRTREFVMKDGYSFHYTQESLKETYEMMYQTYSKIFTQMGLKFLITEADNGAIGGHLSHEFQVIIKNNKNYSIQSEKISCNDINRNLSAYIAKSSDVPIPYKEEMKAVFISNSQSIDDLMKDLNLPVTKTTKTVIVHAKKNMDHSLIALMIRGDHQLDNIKAEKLSQVAVPLSFANEQEIRSVIGASLKFLGPINMPLPLIVDQKVASMNNFITGANIDNKYFFGVNWNKDLPIPQIEDLRKITFEKKQPKQQKSPQIRNNIEIAHIFQLGTKYSNIIKIKDKNNRLLDITMGCYGIGIARIIAAHIEQNHDKHGILWPDILAPFNVAILPINLHKSAQVNQVSEKIYNQLALLNIDVLFDDRKEHIGVMYNDMELIGVPHIIVISDSTLSTKETEYKNRKNGKNRRIKIDKIVDYIVKKIRFLNIP
ncbi:proline--tRNA ligase [Blochmannia endosymbiont of Colobopsis nipponica]|uniref:proline--tRNA ligase n=1 Tax=Blochmannia endosymbiont of Colobopsis nipponica TaxID=2681987 RepID=UPI00177D76FC|nr:proline--tRNA ligase [Blochmannia endosymbiont of Colobopsis nipponica]QOI11149.1 proline--tRNA ligase [Blochmannia endosymbiont of Colobopsis nipponica]